MPSTQSGSHSYFEWTLKNTETGDTLVPIGGREVTAERLSALNEGGDTRFVLVTRLVTRGEWEEVGR